MKPIKKMRRKTMNEEKIREKLEWNFYVNSGFKMINGGYADVPNENFEIEKSPNGNYARAVGIVHTGVQDMGSGHSRQYTDEFDLCLKLLPEDNFRIVDDDKCNYI